MSKVSVIIPIYGVEQYIERCAVHLFEQTLEDMEFIFVNDCTTDNSIEVLKSVIERYPNRQNQIRIIDHEKNRGLSWARQTGVQAAKGEYIAHCDSDDWVDAEMYEVMYKIAIENDSDVVKCGYKICGDECVVKENNVCPDSDVISNEKAVSLLLTYKGWNSIWDTIVKRSIYFEKQILYTDMAMLEDMVVMSQILSYAKQINIVHRNFYNYYKNPNSITRKSKESDYINRPLQAAQNLRLILRFVQSFWGDRFRNEIIVTKFFPRVLLISVMANKDNYQYWYQTFPEVCWSIYFCKNIHLSYKIRSLMVELHVYPLYAKIKRLFVNRVG